MKKNYVKYIGIFAAIAVVLFGVVYGGLTLMGNKNSIENAGKRLSRMASKIEAQELELTKGTVELSKSNLADELPDISKYPLGLQGDGEINLEIFSSPEKAGEGTDGWLLEVGKKFNQQNIQIGGKKVTVSIRSISSGTANDYIVSGKYVPDAFTPSNSLWGSMMEAQGVNVEMVEERLAGNVAGILVSNKVKKKVEEKYKKVNLQTVVKATEENEIAMGYTNPFYSSTGLNFLLETLYSADNDNILSDKAVKNFGDFQKNVPFVAYTTVQMREAADSGSLDGMIMEYQIYANDKALQKYTFVPFGVRHDNPLYAVGNLSDEKKQALQQFAEFCKDKDSQKIASDYGFNKEDSYKSKLPEFKGEDIIEAQKLWKENKDGGNTITAVFVADISGSMDGEPINELKNSLINAGQYINEENSIGLVSFNNDVFINLPVGKFDLNQRAYFNGAVNKLTAVGGTATYDGITVATDMLVKAKEADPATKPVLFLLSDGQKNIGYDLDDVRDILKAYQIPVYSIAYGDNTDMDELKAVSSINEATTIDADSDDVVYKLKNLFNAQM